MLYAQNVHSKQDVVLKFTGLKSASCSKTAERNTATPKDQNTSAVEFDILAVHTLGPVSCGMLEAVEEDRFPGVWYLNEASTLLNECTKRNGSASLKERQPCVRFDIYVSDRPCEFLTDFARDR